MFPLVVLHLNIFLITKIINMENVSNLNIKFKGKHNSHRGIYCLYFVYCILRTWMDFKTTFMFFYHDKWLKKSYETEFLPTATIIETKQDNTKKHSWACSGKTILWWSKKWIVLFYKTKLDLSQIKPANKSETLLLQKVKNCISLRKTVTQKHKIL